MGAGLHLLDCTLCEFDNFSDMRWSKVEVYLQNNPSSMFNSSTVCHLRKELLSLLSKEGSRSRRFGQMGAALLACGRQREHTDIEPPETTHTALQCIT